VHRWSCPSNNCPKKCRWTKLAVVLLTAKCSKIFCVKTYYLYFSHEFLLLPFLQPLLFNLREFNNILNRFLLIDCLTCGATKALRTEGLYLTRHSNKVPKEPSSSLLSFHRATRMYFSYYSNSVLEFPEYGTVMPKHEAVIKIILLWMLYVHLVGSYKKTKWLKCSEQAISNKPLFSRLM